MRNFRLHFPNEIIQLQLLGRRNNPVHSKSQLENLISICWLLSCIIYFHRVKEVCKRFVLFIPRHSRSNCDAESTMHINIIEFELFNVLHTDARAHFEIQKKFNFLMHVFEINNHTVAYVAVVYVQRRKSVARSPLKEITEGEICNTLFHSICLDLVAGIFRQSINIIIRRLNIKHKLLFIYDINSRIHHQDHGLFKF